MRVFYFINFICRSNLSFSSFFSCIIDWYGAPQSSKNEVSLPADDDYCNTGSFSSFEPVRCTSTSSNESLSVANSITPSASSTLSSKYGTLSSS